MTHSIFDVIIIGGGPAGLAVAHTIHGRGLSYQVFEKGPIGSHIAQYPTFMRFFSTNENLQIAGFPIGIVEEKPSRQQYLKYLADFSRYHDLNIQTYAEVTGTKKNSDGVFETTVCYQSGEEKRIYSKAVIVAVGAWESPRKLDVPGADLDKVHYRYTENHNYLGKKVLVVGGRNSAIETALELFRAGVDVSLSYRNNEFTGRGVKYWLKPDIDNRIKKDEIHGFLNTNVTRIDWESVELTDKNGKRTTIENDFVLPMLGYDPPVEFLKKIGIQLEEETNIPAYNPETLETPTPGLFVSGVIINGNVSGKVFIENSRHHGELIAPRLLEYLKEADQTSSTTTAVP